MPSGHAESVPARREPAERAPAATALASHQARRAWWMRHLLQWHWISSAICLVGMLMFSFTGITLNHSGSIEAAPQRNSETRTLPAELLGQLAAGNAAEAPLPTDVRRWIGRELGRHVPAFDAEWSDDEIYLALPRPGGDAWLAIDRASGELEYELTDRGTVAWLNDLHKGRNTGAAWSWFIDLFAVACLVFSLTGLFILAMHARQRASVWPLVSLGALLPALLILLFMH
jgi:hypothetical protein